MGWPGFPWFEISHSAFTKAGGGLVSTAVSTRLGGRHGHGRCTSPCAVLLRQKPTHMVKTVPELALRNSHLALQRRFSALQPAVKYHSQVGTHTADRTKVHGVDAGAGVNSSDTLKLNAEMSSELPAWGSHHLEIGRQLFSGTCLQAKVFPWSQFLWRQCHYRASAGSSVHLVSNQVPHIGE